MLTHMIPSLPVPIVRGLLFCVPWWYKTLLGAMKKFYHPSIWKSIFTVQSLEHLLQEIDSEQLPDAIGGTAADGYDHAQWCDSHLHERC